jgi:hypothetical protein
MDAAFPYLDLVLSHDRKETLRGNMIAAAYKSIFER